LKQTKNETQTIWEATRIRNPTGEDSGAGRWVGKGNGGRARYFCFLLFCCRLLFVGRGPIAATQFGRGGPIPTKRPALAFQKKSPPKGRSGILPKGACGCG